MNEWSRGSLLLIGLAFLSPRVAQHHTGACSNHGGVAEWLDSTQK